VLGLGLVSGGLDSLTACLLLQQQGIEIVGLNFKSPFCLCDKVLSHSECGLNLFHEKLGIKIHSLSKGDDYLEIVRNPKYGYGKNLNPCIDCRIYILKKAIEFNEKIGADFIFTGEVLNQRPKSQHMKALKIVEKESGLEKKLLRPLSALQLEPTIYEEQGLIDRAKLLGIRGRSRKIQLELVRKHELLDQYFACGGCLLTDQNFSKRMRDYLKFNDSLKMEDINILKEGRHFRFQNTKIIVGRNEIENNNLLRLKKPDDLIMEVEDIPGPITIVQGELNEESLKFAALLTFRYSDSKETTGKIIYGEEYQNLTKSIIVENENKEVSEVYLL
jgi:tRNA U34 2-thiouridine synthase MnmA/TrmU